MRTVQPIVSGIMTVVVVREGDAVTKTKAKRQSADFLPIIRDIRASGVTSAHAIAQELNARGIRSARGGFWQSTQVQRVLAKTP